MIVALLDISLIKELHRDPHYQALHPHAPELAAVPGPVDGSSASVDERATEGAGTGQPLIATAAQSPRSTQ